MIAYYKNSKRRTPAVGDVTDKGAVTGFTDENRVILDGEDNYSYLPCSLTCSSTPTDTQVEIPVEAWFNPHYRDHITAFKILRDTGAWPENFIPSTVSMTVGWNSILTDMLAECWIDDQTI